MDTLTHGLSGALVGRILSAKAKKSHPKTFLMIGFWAACFPDFDFLFNLISAESYFVNHRGITHSFILLPLWAGLISYLFALMFKHKIFFTNNWVDESASVKDLSKDFFILSACSITIHILGDIITQFGTMFLSPFSDRRFELGSVFIIDLFFTGIILAGLFISWVSKKYKSSIAFGFLIALVGYVGYTQMMKKEAEEIALNYLKTQAVSNFIIYSSPRQVSSNNWSISALDKEKEIYYTTDFSLSENKKIDTNYKNQNFIELFNSAFPSYKEAQWVTIPLWGRTDEEKSFSRKVWNNPQFKLYRWFYYIPVFDSMTKDNEKNCAYFRDLRFSGVGRQNGTPFVFGLCEYKDGNIKRVQLKNGQNIFVDKVAIQVSFEL